jgi:hypothetical protein
MADQVASYGARFDACARTPGKPLDGRGKPRPMPARAATLLLLLFALEAAAIELPGPSDRWLEAVERQPDSPRAWLAPGVTYLHSDDDPAPGIAVAQRAALLDPANERTPRVLGRLRDAGKLRDDMAG